MKILVVGPSWVGDIVLSHTLFQLLVDLHRSHSGNSCIIDVLAPGWSAPLLNRMPEVRRVIDMPLGHGKLGLGLRRQLGQTLRKEGYDRAIVLPNSFKSAIVPFAAKIPERVGWRGEMRYALLTDVRVLQEDKYPCLAQRFAALAFSEGEALPKALPPPSLATRFSQAKEVCDKFNLRYDRGPVVALCPNAESVQGEPSVVKSMLKQARSEKAVECSAEYYGRLAAALKHRGCHVWLLGTAKQRSFAKTVVKAAGGSDSKMINLAGSTCLKEVIDLLSIASCTVTDDAGLKQVSAALGKPTVAIGEGDRESDIAPIEGPMASTVYFNLIGGEAGLDAENALNLVLVQVDNFLENQRDPISCALS